MKTIQINIVLNEIPKKMSFEEMEQMTKGDSAFKKFYCYCKKGILRGGNDVENFAKDFFTTYHPDHYKNTFKLILEMGTAKLIQITNKQ